MPGPKRTPKLLDELALAIAQGVTVRQWALTNKVNERTASDWAKLPSVREQVNEMRRRFVDANVGMLVVLSPRATKELGTLLVSAKAPSIRLAAARTILDKVIDISNWADYEVRLAAIEKRLNLGDTVDHETEKA
jgi:hypothetical protein